MRLRDVKNIKKPYELKEQALIAYRNRALECLSHEDFEVRQQAAEIIMMCDQKLGQAKEYTMSFHFQILFCAVLIIIAVFSMMRG